LGVGRVRPAIAGGEVFQQLDPRAARGSQCGDAETRAEDVIEVLLLRAEVFAVPDFFQAELVAIKREAAIGIVDHNRGVIDACKKFRVLLPTGIAFALGELNDLQDVIIRIGGNRRL